MESAEVLITEKSNSGSWTDQLLRCWKENMNYNLGFPRFSSKILFAHPSILFALSSIHPFFVSRKMLRILQEFTKYHQRTQIRRSEK